MVKMKCVQAVGIEGRTAGGGVFAGPFGDHHIGFDAIVASFQSNFLYCIVHYRIGSFLDCLLV